MYFETVVVPLILWKGRCVALAPSTFHKSFSPHQHHLSLYLATNTLTSHPVQATCLSLTDGHSFVTLGRGLQPSAPIKLTSLHLSFISPCRPNHEYNQHLPPAPQQRYFHTITHALRSRRSAPLGTPKRPRAHASRAANERSAVRTRCIQCAYPGH